MCSSPKVVQSAPPPPPPVQAPAVMVTPEEMTRRAASSAAAIRNATRNPLRLGPSVQGADATGLNVPGL